MVWDAETGEQKWQAHGHETQVNDLGFNRAGDLLATTSWEGSLRMWDAATGRLVTGHAGSSY